MTSATPSNHSSGVDETAQISFFFSHPLPFSTEFLSHFAFAEPKRRLSVRHAILDHDTQDRPTIVRLTVDHQAETDYVWVVYGLPNARGEFLREPYVLNYSTASSSGNRSFSGHVIIGDEGPGDVAILSEDVAAMVAAGRFGRIEPGFIDTRLSASKTTAGTDAPVRSRMVAGGLHLDRTVVLLLERHSVDQRSWQVVAGGNTDSQTAAFSLSNARSGVYFPLAITFRENDSSTIDAFGFYDVNGDHVPDPVDFRRGDVHGVPLVMYEFVPITAKSGEVRARETAAALLDDGILIDVTAADASADDGTSRTWAYSFLSPSRARVLRVIMDPVSARIEERSATDADLARQAIHDLPLDSPLIMSAAEEAGGRSFRNSLDAAPTVTMTLGDTAAPFRPVQPDVIWSVRYSGQIAGHDSTLTVFVDPAIGETLPGTWVGAEPPSFVAAPMVGSPYPNPFAHEVTLAIEVASAAEVSIEVYNLLGQRIMQSQEYVQAGNSTDFRWDGRDASPGVYFLKVTLPDGQTHIRSVVRIGN